MTPAITSPVDFFRSMKRILLFLLLAASANIVCAEGDPALAKENESTNETVAPTTAKPYKEMCSAAFMHVFTREDISTTGPSVYRYRKTGRISAEYPIGFMGFFVVTFDQSTPPKINGSYFTDFLRKTRYENFTALEQGSLALTLEELRKKGVHIN